MALKTLCSLFTFTFLLNLLSLLSYAASSLEPHNKNSSAFEFLDHLKGVHKGDHIPGIHDLKLYLENFGYLSYAHAKHNPHADDDDFDDFLELAVKTYQLNYHLKTTGILDTKTVSKMMMPRCGVADIINGATSTQSGKKKHRGHNHDHDSNVYGVSHYSFFKGKLKWPRSKHHLTYAFLPTTPTEAMGPISRAFRTWATNTHFRFSRSQNYKRADIKISFEYGDHGDGSSFDGPGGVLAHAYAPTYGKFHYDAEEPWSVGALEGYYDLETVALHEIGHLLGLGHSSVEGAVMYPYIASGATNLYLHDDDIQGIKVLYKS
ncbi:unnamed protein product [Prunus armeniaca]|uniref:Peptidase metallopeptidase domain-containing protein n=1 Tax=Prunus armeniaca TaxID=36596 RepID=A0A6J5W1L2_PRUAR|nr:unnamed protein product [Prunus armeniaca]